MFKDFSKTLTKSIIWIYFLSNILPIYALDTIYRFFPTIDDKNAIITIQPSTEWLWKYEIVTNVSQYENLPKFNRMLLEIWKKQKDWSFENVWNEVYDKGKITDEGVIWTVTEELDPLAPPILEGDTMKKEYVTFKKVEIPYYKSDQLQKTYFDVSFKSLNIIHRPSNDWKVYPIKIAKKNYNHAVEVQLTLDKPEQNANTYKYVVNLDTDKLPYEIRQLLWKRKFDKLYIRDSKQNYYNFAVMNKFQFWLNYSTDYPKQYGDDPGRKSFIQLGNSFYYFSDLGWWQPTTNNITTMINSCNDKGWYLDSWTTVYNWSNTILDYFISQNRTRKAYWIFMIRICKKDSPVYSNLKLAIEIPSNRFDVAGKLTLFMWISENSNPSKVVYSLKDISWTKFSDYQNNVVPIIKPEENLIFDETDAWIIPKENDKLVLNIRQNKIYYYEWDPDYQKYKKPKEFLPNSAISKDILIISNKNAQYKVQVYKLTNRYRMLLDMTPYEYGEYMLKLTPIYEDNYFIKFKAVNKCYPDLITDADKLIFSKIKDNNWNLIENKITDILRFKDDFFDYLVNNDKYNNILLFDDKLKAACADVTNDSSIRQKINDLYLSRIGAKTLSSSSDLQQICYFLVNNGKFLDVKWWTTITYDLSAWDPIDVKKLTLELTPKDFNDSLSYNVDSSMVNGYSPTVSIKYECLTRDSNTGSVSKYNVFEQIQLYQVNRIGKSSYNSMIPYNTNSIRYYYNY